MNIQYVIRAKWGQRAESDCECAERAVRYMRMLAGFDMAFSRWYELGRSEPRPADWVQPDVGRLEALFRGNTQRTDFGGEIMPDMPRSVMFWNGSSRSSEGKTSQITMTCGGDTPYVTNLALLRLPNGEEFRGRVLHAERIAELIRGAVEAWEPDSVAVFSAGQLRRVVCPSNLPDVGWALYLPDRYGHVLPEPGTRQVVPISGYGTVYMASAIPPMQETPEEIAGVQAFVDEIGALYGTATG